MNKLERVSKINWEIVVSFKTEFLTECLAQNSFHKVKVKLGLPLNRELILDNDIAHDAGEMLRARNIIKKNINRASQKIFSEITKQSKLFIKTSKELLLSDDKKLLINIKKWFDLYSDTVGLINVPGRLDEVLENEIRSDLEKYGIKAKEKVFRTIAQADKLSGVSEEKLELMKLSLSVSEGKIKKHAQKYSWINITLLLGDLYSEKEVIKKIRKIKKDRNIKEKISEFRNTIKENQKELNFIIKHYKLAPALVKKIKILRNAIWFRTARLDWLNQGCALARSLLNKVAERIGLTYEELIYCSPEEIIKALSQNKKITNKKEIYKRIEKYAMWTLDGKRHDFVLGQEVNKLKSLLFKEKSGETKK